MKKRFAMLMLASLAAAAPGGQRVTLIEEFSSSTCTDCPVFHKNVLTPFAQDTANRGKFTHVNYPANWPLSGDPYFSAEADARINFYELNTLPACFFDGGSILTEKTFDSLPAFTAAFDSYYAKPANVAVAARHSVTDTSLAKAKLKIAVAVNADLDTATPPLRVFLHIALVEKKTKKNVKNNGEKEFCNVLMKMVPGAKGTPLTIQKKQADTITDSAALAGTHIEEPFDLAVVVWIQDSASKKVLQSAWSIDENPLPVTNIKSPLIAAVRERGPLLRGLFLYNTEGAAVSIYDLAGRLLFAVEKAPAVVNLAEARLVRGCFIVRAVKDGSVVSRMITIVR